MHKLEELTNYFNDAVFEFAVVLASGNTRGQGTSLPTVMRDEN